MNIKSVKGYELLDSRGNPTVAAKIICENGAVGFATKADIWAKGLQKRSRI